MGKGPPELSHRASRKAYGIIVFFMTAGATLNEYARILKAIRANRVCVVTLARG